MTMALDDPSSIEQWIDTALQHHHAGRLREAEMLYRKALAARPDHPDALHLLGFIAYQCGRHDQAIELISAALRVCPDAADFHNHLGLVFAAQGRIADAGDAYRNALQRTPDFPEAHNNLGILLRDAGRLADAEAHYRAAIAARPSFVDAWNNLGNVYRDRGDVRDALDAYRTALRLQPDFAAAHSNVLFMLSHYSLGTPDELLNAHLEWDRTYGGAGRAGRYRHRHDGDPDRRLRIGYVSPDFRFHAASSFFEPLIARHDHAVVEVFCYSEAARSDAMTQRIRSHADAWRMTAGASDEALAQQIHEDRVDILVDLAGHTTANRLRAFTWKPAPIQASWLGYCATTGLDAMDYWITDDVIHPRDTIERAVETIIRLPRCWVTYRPPLDAPDVALPERDNVVFGCFNERSKISEEAVVLWSRILGQLPQSRLVLKARQYADEGVKRALIDAFARHEVSASRLTFLPASRYADYLAAYRDVDIALDPLPRTGGVTTADALWMGVPVITLRGQRFIERHCASLLHAADMEEFVAASPDQYVAKAVSLARDGARRRAMRRTQRDRLRRTPLCDAADHARAMEALFRRMWQAYLNDRRLTE